jgi:hypothetical protein
MNVHDLSQWFAGVPGLMVLVMAAACGSGTGLGLPDAGGTAGGDGGMGGTDGAIASLDAGVAPVGDAGVPVDRRAGETVPGEDGAADALPVSDTGPGPPEVARDAGGGDAAVPVSCDQRKVTCKMMTPLCGEGEFPSVVGTCWDACVKVDRCMCTTAEECPISAQYTCHLSRQRCGPYLF